MTVDAATKRKLKLTSTTIAKGTSKPAGEGVNIKMVATAVVRNKLKVVKTIVVTYTVAATSPITETFKQTVVMNVNKTGAGKRLLIRSSGDTFDLSGGGAGSRSTDLDRVLGAGPDCATVSTVETSGPGSVMSMR